MKKIGAYPRQSAHCEFGQLSTLYASEWFRKIYGNSFYDWRQGESVPGLKIATQMGLRTYWSEVIAYLRSRIIDFILLPLKF